MADDNDSSQNIEIRCPKCRQRFSVDENLKGRTVECGGCDEQFQISGDVILKSKKFYPGERKELVLNNFQSAPITTLSPAPRIKTIQYEEFNHPERLEPAPPLRIIAGIAGVSLMIFTGLLLLLSTSPSAALAAMPIQNKLIVGGFASLLGFSLLVYANPRTRIKAGLIGLVIAAGVMSIPFFYKGNELTPAMDNEFIMDTPIQPLFPDEEAKSVEKLRARFATAPLEEEQKKLTEAGIEEKAIGIFLTGMQGRNKYTTRDYLIRESRASFTSHLYPRDNDNFLMVLTGVQATSDEVVQIAARLGQVKEIHPEINVVVVQVNNELFTTGSADKLNDKSQPQFYALNQLELMCIDISRVEKAVERLADADATIFRGDISSILIELLKKPGITFHDTLARALLKWADDTDEAADVGLDVLKTYALRDIAAPENLVTLVANGKKPEAVATLVNLWVSNPILWDDQLVKFGTIIEPFVLEKLNSEEASLSRSAAKILGEIGTKKSLPALHEILNQKDPEIRVLAERSIKEIEAR